MTEKLVMDQLKKTGEHNMNNLYRELSEKFGIKANFTKKQSLNKSPRAYVLASEATKRQEEGDDINTVLFYFIEERGRIIKQGQGSIIYYQDWFQKWHPEMVNCMSEDNLKHEGASF